jgi:hypothetical protein
MEMLIANDSLDENHPVDRDFAAMLRRWGAIEAGIDIVLSLGRKCFGEPSRRQVTKLKKISNLETLLSLTEHIYDVKSWDELLSKAV